MLQNIASEAIFSIKNNKTRSLVTGLGVAWGICILIVLVGVGKAMQLSVLNLFKGFSKSAVYVFGMNTTEEYNGLAANRKITFTINDMLRLRRNVPEIQGISPETKKIEKIGFEKNINFYETKAVYPDYFTIKLLKASTGRVLNMLDFQQSRKVIVLGAKTAVELFGKGKTAVGQNVVVNGIYFKVIGIIENNITTLFEERTAYIPFSTYAAMYTGLTTFDALLLSIYDGKDTKNAIKKIRQNISQWNFIKPTDEKAIYFNSMQEQVSAFNNLFNGINKFLWFMGLSTLVGGVIGVANIMYISVKERTKEIGIRKAMGAKKAHLKLMIMIESILLTTLAGSIGIFIGFLVLQLIGLFIGTGDKMFFEKPALDVNTTIGAIFILILSGLFAGMKPAIYAANLKPVEALRQE